MNRFLTYSIIALMLMTTACKTNTPAPDGFTPKTPVLTSNRLTPEVLWKLGRIGGETVSPNHSMVLFSITYFNIDENKGFKDWYIYEIETKQTTRITNTAENENEATWRPDGKKIGFLSSKSGNNQLWEMDIDGSNRKQITFIDGGITGFKYSPNLENILLIRSIKLDKTINDLHPDLPKANARIETDLMYRHWDSWHDFTYNHIFLAKYSEKGIHNAVDIMENERFDAPMKPFGGTEEMAWKPDGKSFVYTSKKKSGKDYAVSTNSEIWHYHLETQKTENLSEGLMGYDKNPVFSPDGSKLAWESMARDGYESDQSRLYILDLRTGERTNCFENFEESASSLCWTEDGNNIYFISDIQASDEIFRYNLVTKEINRVTNGIHDYKSVQLLGDKLLARKHSMSYPDELYLVNFNGEEKQITDINKPITDQLKFGEVQKRWVKTTDGKQMLVWVILPPDFDPSKKYPALLYCQGGPQGTVSQFWSYRWNFQIMAANDYIIVAPNRRGLPGFGMEWLEQISTDYGGQNIKDYLSAIDDVANETWVDENKLGAIGASYGGFSVYYLAGHHEKRFKAFVSHCGIFNFEQLYTTTEEMWFVNWDLGGAYWDKENKSAQRSYTFSPHRFVDKWDTPILVIHGGNDFRIPYTQGMAAYNAAQMRGIPSKFLFFPEENHWVLKPQNGILWQRTFFEWLDQWLK